MAQRQQEGESGITKIKLEAKQSELQEEIVKMKKFDQKMGIKTFEERQDYKRSQSSKQWAMIGVVESQLLVYACLDFTA